MYALTVHASEEIAGPTPLALDSEWLLTNGLGGFAMGTISACNTRRYHGMLNAAVKPPVGRVNTVTCVGETVSFGGQWHELKCQEFVTNEYPNRVFHPHGYKYLHRFEKSPAAVRWHYRVGPLAIVKELRLVWRKSKAIVTYTLNPAPGSGDLPAAVTLSLLPMFAMRDFHQHRRASSGEAFAVERLDAEIGVSLKVSADGNDVYLRSDAGSFVEKRDWWYGFLHRREADRGQDAVEDLFTAGSIEHTFDLTRGMPCRLKLFLSTEPPADPAMADFDDGRSDHLRRCIAHVKERIVPDAPHVALIEGLAVATDDFIASRTVDGRECRTILAGFPWFADWGRDTMISLPGLLLCTGRFEEAGRTLVTYARSIRNGLVPNCFDDYGGEPHYNTVDASLWFIHAALEYRRLSGDERLWKDVLEDACGRIVAAYEKGTEGPIRMDGDGLIAAGDAQTQLTWMDAKRDGVAFTPRHGKCVEINALWHRALVGLGQAKLAARVKNAFEKTFWSEDLGYLFDHVNEGGADKSLRPNQVLAVSLPDSPLPVARQKAVMRAVREKLLTPMGLRTLSKDSPNYHGRYTGSMFDRDKAYHQGTVWAWLIGPYVEGWLRAHDFSDEAKAHCREALTPLLRQLPRASVGQLHEVFDGDEPHRPGGCIAQAWSIAETLRAVMLVENAK